ncbi:MAG: class I SAM-dependent methyltransferase [Saprospiraceae bacterium]
MKDTNDYRNSHTADGYGKSYDALFKDNPYRKYIWDLEKKTLDNIIQEYYNNKVANYLDFACGTGRIVGHLEQYADKPNGVDISAAMLEVAKKNVKLAKLTKADLTTNNVFEGQKFDLITSFRFFLNAQNELRYQVMEQLSKLLTDDGYLIFNIHNNTTGLTNQISKLYTTVKYRKVIERKEMSISEVKKILDKNGLKIEKMYNYATYPIFHEEKPFNQGLVSTVDRLNEKVLGINALSTYIIYLCKKK